MSQPKKALTAQLFSWLTRPLAIGVYISLGVFTLTSKYYGLKNSMAPVQGFMSFVQDFDQKSIDYRLKLRGARPGSERVAILAVDDRAVETIGRWPWPRDVTARAIHNTMKYGAKVIAADMTFSEVSHRSDVELIKSLEEKNLIPNESKDRIQSELESLDPDRKFGDLLEPMKNSFILGNFYSNSMGFSGAESFAGYTSACAQLIFDNTSEEKIWKSDNELVAATDPAEAILPGVIADIYKEQLAAIEDSIRKSSPNTGSANEAFHLRSMILSEKQRFCFYDFLNNEKDPNFQLLAEAWTSILEADKTLSHSSFDEWAQSFKTKYEAFNVIPETFDWTMNIPALTTRGAYNGYFNAIIEGDGVIRQSQLIMRSANTYVPSIALRAYLIASNANPNIEVKELQNVPGTKGLIRLQALSNETGDVIQNIPVKPDGKLVINYAGPQHTFAHVSLADMLDESSDELTLVQKSFTANGKIEQDQSIKVKKSDYLKDKIFILGATALGIYDLRVTPFDENFPGVETHANVVDNLLRSDYLYVHNLEQLYMPFATLLIGLLLALALTRLGALSGLAITFLCFVGIASLDRFMLFGQGILVSIIFPLTQTGFSYIGMTFYKYLTEERNKKELRATFSKYVSPAIVEEVLKDPKNLELGGRKEHITVFFSDVRGFTTISEKLDPRALSDLLNSYLTPMTELVFKNKGTLDKYMGDAIMAFFGAPIHYPDHAKLACSCALQHLVKLKELQEEYARKGLPSIDIGIGLNTGECNVGNMGSQTVRNYTVMGDAVNLASRLEGINKTYGTRIIISEFTHAEIKGDFLCREVDWVRVKGKIKPVKIFELIAEGKPDNKLYEMSQNFSEGYELYHKRQFKEAIAKFDRALGHNSQDDTSKIFIQRCEEFLAEPPPSDWDGVYVMKTK